MGLWAAPSPARNWTSKSAVGEKPAISRKMLLQARFLWSEFCARYSELRQSTAILAGAREVFSAGLTDWRGEESFEPVVQVFLGLSLVEVENRTAKSPAGEKPSVLRGKRPEERFLRASFSGGALELRAFLPF